MLNAITDQALEVGSRLSKFLALTRDPWTCTDFTDTWTVEVGCRDFEGTTTASLKT